MANNSVLLKMKQKSINQFKLNEKYYNKKINIELNNKIKISRLKSARSSINNLNLVNKTSTEVSDNYNNKFNNIKNLSLKAKLSKLLLEKEKNTKNGQDKYYKKIPYNKTSNDLFFGSKDILNNMTPYNENNQSEYRNEIYNGKYKNLNNIYFKKDNINIKQNNTPSKCEKKDNQIKYIKKISNSKKKSRILEYENEKNNINSYANKTANELEYKKEYNENCNKNKKGTFSFATFIKTHNENVCDEEKTMYNDENENKKEKEQNYFDVKLKEKIKNKSIKKLQEVNSENNTANNTVKDIKKKNNIILLNFRSDKRRFIRENRISTSSEKEVSVKTGALKILELLKNKKNEKIILKQKEKKEKNKILFNIKSNEENKENKNENIKKEIKDDDNKINPNSEIIENNEFKENNTIKNINNSLGNDEKKNCDIKNIFNDIIEEVKQEKNYIQKIVHRKLIEGVKELKQNNSCHKYNVRYNTRTYKDINTRNTFGYSNLTSKFNSNEEKNLDNNNNYINHNNIICSSLLSSNREKNNKRYLNINIDEFQNKKKYYEKDRTYNNTNMNRNSYDNFNIDNNNDKKKNENSRVKIKKIKLDKLRNKIQKNKLNYNGDNNININLNLNNKIINIHNSQKIYMPKKASITKRPSLEVMSIPLYNSHSPDYKNNSLPPSIYTKNEVINSTFINNIKPFNELAIFDLDNNIDNNANNNKYSNSLNNISNINNINNINRNTIINIKNKNNKSNLNIKNINISTSDINNINNNNEKIKHILYSKAKIKKLSESKYNKNISSSRCKTIRYIKKNKNKIERVDSKKRDNSNKIIKIQEMQFGGVSKKTSEKTINNLDKTEPTTFNVNSSPFNKQNSFIKYRTFLSSDINETPNINLNENKKENIINSSQLYSTNNGEDPDDNFTTKKYNTSTSKLGYNFSYDKIKNNITGTDDIDSERNEIKLKQIFNLLSFEDLLIIEDKFNLILIVLEKGNKTFEEYFDLWNYFFSSGLRSKFEQVFKYFPKETETMKYFVNHTLIFIIICYDFAANSISIDIDNNFSLIEIAQIIYTNLLIVINLIKTKISSDNKDNYNIRLIELSKIELTIKNKLSNIDNDFLFIKEILNNNSNLIIKKVTSIIESNILNNISNKKYNSELFRKINNINFEEINKFFLENILKEDFLGCSVLASTYIKEKQNFTPALVPYIRLENKKKYSLVIDLDETLIHFTVNNNANEEGVLKLRPGVFSFLEKVGKFYEIILFTEASEAYTKLMMEAFNNNKNKKYFDYKLYRQHCIIVEQDFIKDLSRIGRPLDKTIIIDNIAQNFKMQKKNGILIKPFLGEDQNDQALIDLIPILINIARDEIDVKNGLMKYRDEILTKISSNLFRRNKHK